MKKAIIFLALTFLFLACSDVEKKNSSNKNSNLAKSSVENRLANKDYSNKPVNLNLPKEREKFDKLIDELNQNRKIWKEKNISNYDFHCEKFAEGVGSDFILTFKVRDNNPVPFENLEYPKPYAYEGLETFDKIFDLTQNWLENGVSVRIKYNKIFGYPEEIDCIAEGTAWWQVKIKKIEIK